MPKQVLIVDDDQLLCRSLAYSLQNAGYEPAVANSAEDALRISQQHKPDLVLLDIGLPAMDGLGMMRELQSHYPIPVILVTARRRELDEIVGLEVGADDYITKPFDTDVLLAHIKAVLRRSATYAVFFDSQITVGELHINPLAHSVHVGTDLIELSPKEFQLLLIFAQHINHVFSVDELIRMVWGDQWIGETQTIYVHIRWLRQKIEIEPECPKRLLTVRGAGYKLVP
jgi:DNA-binding response OmpR family regulator